MIGGGLQDPIKVSLLSFSQERGTRGFPDSLTCAGGFACFGCSKDILNIFSMSAVHRRRKSGKRCFRSSCSTEADWD